MIRDTKQRRAIRQVFEQANRPLSPEEVHQYARATVKGLGIATVYRTIKSLLEEGWLVPVELPGMATRYEIAGKGHHHHFICRECGRAYEIEQCPGDLSYLTPSDFRFENHEVFVYGLCASCIRLQQQQQEAPAAMVGD